MATREQLELALRNAHAAGDSHAARRFAAEIKNTPAKVDERALFDALPIWKKPVQAADDALRIGSNALTLDWRDKLAGMIGGGTPEEERAKTAAAKERAGSAALPLEILGQLPLLKGLPPAAAMIPATMSPVKRGVFSTMLGGLEGAGIGGVNALGKDEDLGEGMLEGGLWGAGGQLVGDMLAGGANTVKNMFTKNPGRMSPDQMRVLKDRAYRDVDDIGVEYTPAAIDDLTGQIDDAVSGTWPERHPQARAASRRTYDSLRGDPRVPRTLTEVDQARQAIGKNVSAMPDPAEASFGMEMENRIEKWMRDADASKVTTKSGSPEEGIEALGRAQDLNSRFRKLEEMDTTTKAAQRRASRNLNSGVDSTLKQNIDSVLGSKKRSSRYKPDELEKMDEVVQGTTGLNFLRQSGKIAPGGGWSWPATAAAGGAGFAVGGPVGSMVAAPIPAILGILAKGASQRGTQKAVGELSDLIASGGNKAAIAKTKAMGKGGKDQLARLLMMLGINQDD